MILDATREETPESESTIQGRWTRLQKLRSWEPRPKGGSCNSDQVRINLRFAIIINRTILLRVGKRDIYIQINERERKKIRVSPQMFGTPSQNVRSTPRKHKIVPKQNRGNSAISSVFF